MVNGENYKEILTELAPKNVQLVAVSKIQTVSDIKKLYELGQRDFGENYVQELVEKQAALPADIRWHFIGHLQSNKVKQVVPFVHLIHGVDTQKLLVEIAKQSRKLQAKTHCLLQVHIAQEETKFGLDAKELEAIMSALQADPALFSGVFIDGLMGMASFTDDIKKVRVEMKYLKSLFDTYQPISTPNCQLTKLSMGMSGDYKTAIEEGSNMVRIGSLLFGARPAK
jgi:pyridoxal phosphate enzyme (YggS family)